MENTDFGSAGGQAATGMPGQTVVSVTAAEERRAGEVVKDEGDGARRIIELLTRARVI